MPPEDPRRSLRRVWPAKEEEGRLLRVSMRALATLRHSAHSPVFRADDWKQYQEVNRKFASALIEKRYGQSGGAG